MMILPLFALLLESRRFSRRKLPISGVIAAYIPQPALLSGPLREKEDPGPPFHPKPFPHPPPTLPYGPPHRVGIPHALHNRINPSPFAKPILGSDSN